MVAENRQEIYVPKARPCPRYTPLSDRTFFSPGCTLDKRGGTPGLRTAKNKKNKKLRFLHPLALRQPRSYDQGEGRGT